MIVLCAYCYQPPERCACPRRLPILRCLGCVALALLAACGGVTAEPTCTPDARPVPAACEAAQLGGSYTLVACPGGAAICTYHWPDGTHISPWGCSVDGVECVQACECAP